MRTRHPLFPALVDLVLPATCAGCGAPDEAVCRECHASVESALWPGGPRRCAPQPRPAGLPVVTGCGRYEGALATLVAAYKDDGRRDCARRLGDLLGEAVCSALAGDAQAAAALARGRGPVLVVPVPSSRRARRQRGDAPLRALALRAVRPFYRHEVVLGDVLTPRRRVLDQAGLTAAGRRTNLEYALQVHPWRRPATGTLCLLVDDVMTTGATLVEATRALRAGGLGVVGAAVICATQRRSGSSQDSSPELG